jgi:hypothetical protein
MSFMRQSLLLATRLVGSVVPLLLLGAAGAHATTLQPVESFDQPTYVTSDPADPNRLLVTERLGKIELFAGGEKSTFTDLTSLVGCDPTECSGERGLMSLALAPDFSTSGHLYVFYAQNSSGDLHIDELTASGDTAPLATKRPVLTIPHADDDNHNGGQLQFGPDGALYISTGDGGGGGDTFHNSQDLESLLGKILRIDPEEDGAQPYTVPAGNPFPGAAAPFDTIWSLGFRNPFRFSFDRLTANMVIADVGQSAREEVDLAPSPAPGAVGGGGANYGWNCREGLVEGPADDLPGDGCQTTPFVSPVFDYPHPDPGGEAAHGCAIIGGYVARDAGLGDLYGRYLYADLCVGEIRSLQLPMTAQGSACGDRSEGLSVNEPVSFGEDSSGRLYVVSGGGEVSRLEGPASAVKCVPREGPEPPAGGSTPPAGGSPSPVETTLRVRVARRRVRAGTRALLVAHVLPCEGRRGQRLQLNRGGQLLMSRPLDQACTARFDPRLAHRASFRILVPAIGDYLAARSPRLTVSTKLEKPSN